METQVMKVYLLKHKKEKKNGIESNILKQDVVAVAPLPTWTQRYKQIRETGAETKRYTLTMCT